MPHVIKSHPENPFGKWSTHRATIAALNRADAHDAEAELRARTLLKASRLADKILEVRDDLSAEQRARMVAILTEGA